MRYGLIIVLVVCTGAIVLYYLYFYMASYHHWASREDVETLKLKKLTQWTNQELVSFMKMKEQVYSLRRQRIKQKCYRNPVRNL